MPVKFVLKKQKWYPRPHSSSISYAHGLETGATNRTTNIPIVMYDEGKGDPSLVNANPEHASFAVASEPNCYPESKINKLNCKLRFEMTKAALETDKIHAVRCAYMVVGMSFLEDYTALDELSAATTEEWMQMQHETTDRQGYPAYNGVDMPTQYSNSSNLPTNVPGLTSTQALEAIPWSEEGFYNMIQYGSIAGKLRSIQFGLKWITLTKDRPIREININIKSKVKQMNPYTYLGVITHCPATNSATQLPTATDVTNVNHINVDLTYRYNEWQQNFDMSRQ